MEEEVTLNEVMAFLKETVATKDDLKGFATKDDLKGFATKDDLKALATKADVEQLCQEMHQEFARINLELADIRKQLDRWELRTRQDTDAEAGDILDLRRRVNELEQQVKKLQTNRQPA